MELVKDFRFGNVWVERLLHSRLIFDSRAQIFFPLLVSILRKLFGVITRHALEARLFAKRWILGSLHSVGREAVEDGGTM